MLIILSQLEELNMFTKLKNETSKYGLLINENMTKHMKCTRKQVRGNKLEIDTEF
jgi:hypothetical protein